MKEPGATITRTAQVLTPIELARGRGPAATSGAFSAEFPGAAPAAAESVPALTPPLERTQPLPESPLAESSLAESPPLDDAALSFARERERVLQRAEHSAAVRRLRRTMSIGVVVWVGSTLLDLYVTQFAHEGDLRLLLTLQGIGTLVVLLAIARLRSAREPSVRALWACDAAAFTTVAACASIESLIFRGIDSPYAAGIIVIMLARATTTFSPWRQGMLLFGAPALVYPVAVAVGARIDARIAAQLHDPAALSAFFSMLFFLGASWLMLTLGGHHAWRLRREAAEARSIGRYRLERRLGSGGMADVWAVFDLTLKLRVALKTIAGHRRDPAALARFEREVRALAELRHPNTVRVLDYGVTDDGLWYYTMELLEGENLRQLVAREGPLEIGRAVRIARQVLGALGEAHDKGIVHRDVKPENVFLAQLGGEPDVVKLLDFGVAKAPSSGDLSLTNTGHVVGTPAYMAPELSMGQSAGVRSDIYSFGGMLYFLLSARLPFSDENPAALLAAHMGREPEPISGAVPSPIPEALERVVQRCLAKDPGARYGSTREVLQALRDAA